MKITCCSTSKIPSETANSIQVLLACEGLELAGHEIQLFIPGSGEVDLENVRSQYALHCQAFPLRRLVSRAALKRIDFSLAVLHQASIWGADLIYTWTIQVAALAALRGLPSAFEVHDLPTGHGKSWFSLYSKSKTPKKLLFITYALRDKMLKLYPELKEEDCRITPNGISPQDYLNLPDLTEAKAQMNFPQERLCVSCSGHLYAGRGAKLFIQLAERFPTLDFHWFGGNSDDIETYRNKIAEMQLKNIFFHGFIPRERLPLAQSACDILLMPYGSSIAGSSGGNSAEICSPMKMFEYLAIGRAIISSDLPVIHEVLDNSCAIFCEPENVDSWATALQTLITDPAMRNSLAQEAKGRSSQYTWQKRAENALK